MDEQVMAREKFEKNFDSVVFRSTPKEVFEFLREQEKKRLITLYAGTYSFEASVLMHKGCEKATFYFYLNGYNYGYSLRYFQGRFKLERDERIFFKDHKKAYTKKALSNHKTDRKDMRSGEYFDNNRDLVKNELFGGVFEIIFYFVGVILLGAIGTGVVFLLGIEKDVDYEVVLILGFLALVIVAVFTFIIVSITKSLKDARKEQKR